MLTFDYIIICFFIGMLVGGWFASIFIKILKRNGYVTFDITDKFRNELKIDNNDKL
jgi:hypothetical protein